MSLGLFLPPKLSFPFARREPYALCVSEHIVWPSPCCNKRPPVKKGAHINHKGKHLQVFCLLEGLQPLLFAVSCPQCINRRGKKMFFFSPTSSSALGCLFIIDGTIPGGLLVTWGVLSPPTPHPHWPQGFLSRISDVLLCGWTCQHCCQRCYESSCCQSSEDEVEILGPFPAQTPPWL